MTFVFSDLTELERAWLRKKQAESQLQQRYANYFGNVAACVLVAMSIRQFVSLPILLTWTSLIAVAFNPYWRRWMKRWNKIESGWRFGAWEFRMASLGAGMAALWSLPGLMVPHGGHANFEILVTAVAIGMTSLAMASQTINIAYARTYALVLSVPFALRYLLSGDRFLATVGALSIPFVAYLCVYQSAACRRAVKQIRHEIAVEKLTADLSDANRGLKERLAEVERLRGKAERADKAKSTFLANMSHELRTPLNAIIGFSDMLRLDVFAQKRDEYSQLISDSGRHLLMLIDEILDLSKIEAGKFQVHAAQIEFERLAHECLSLVQVKAQDGCITLAADVAPMLPQITADPRAIKQIVLNLLSNALKFTPRDGVVTLFAHTTQSGEFVFGVSDTGIGIAEEDQSRVFESFGQGRHDALTKDRGTGLGLPIVRGLAGAHGGHVELESVVNVGTTLSVYLPESRVISTQSRPSTFGATRAS